MAITPIIPRISATRKYATSVSMGMLEIYNSQNRLDAKSNKLLRYCRKNHNTPLFLDYPSLEYTLLPACFCPILITAKIEYTPARKSVILWTFHNCYTNFLEKNFNTIRAQLIGFSWFQRCADSGHSWPVLISKAGLYQGIYRTYG